MKDSILTVYEAGDPTGGGDDPVVDPAVKTPEELQHELDSTVGRLEKTGTELSAAQQVLATAKAGLEQASGGQYTMDASGAVIPNPAYSTQYTPPPPEAPPAVEIPDFYADPVGFANWMQEAINKGAQVQAQAIVGQAMGYLMPIVTQLGTQSVAQAFPDWQDIGADVETRCKQQGFVSVVDAQTRNPEYFKEAVDGARYRRMIANPTPAPPTPAPPAEDLTGMILDIGGGRAPAIGGRISDLSDEELAEAFRVGCKTEKEAIDLYNKPVAMEGAKK